ncbi:MAG: ATP-binding protein [Solirubrobacterales bacterium]
MAGTDTAAARAPDSLSLTLEPNPENAAVARHAIAELAHRLGVDEAVRTSAEVVVTEAFTNATRHAYTQGRPGPVEIAAKARDDGFEIVVRDRGEGFRPRPADPDGSGRMGLLLIAALADDVRFLHRPEGGTEVHAALTPTSALRALRSAECPAC